MGSIDDSAAPPAGPTCPQCGTALTGTSRPVPGTTGRLSVHVRNERTLLEQFKTAQDRATDKITAFAGSLSFVYIHSFWFLLWLVVNAGLIGAGVEFDPYPYGLLTLIVSLEAIFLSTFVMVSQNRQSARADLRAQLDFETNLRAEIWTVHIGRQLGISPSEIEGHVQAVLERSATSMAGGGEPGGGSASSPSPLSSDPEVTGADADIAG